MKKKGDATEAAASTARQTKGKRSKPAPSRKKSEGSGIATFATSGLLATTLVVVGMSLALGWLQFGRHQALNEQRLANALAQSQAELVRLSVGHARAQLESLAASELVQRILSDDPTAPEQAVLDSVLPNSKVHLITPEQVLSGNGLSFTARDLAEQVRDGKDPEPVLMPGDPPVLLGAMATPGGDAVLILEWHLDQLKQQMARQDIQQAHLEVRQEGGTVLLSRGEARQGITVNASAPFNIQVKLTLPESSRDGALLGLFALIAAGGLLLALLLQAFVFRAIGQAVRKDGALLANLAQELASDPTAQPRGNFSFRPLALVTGNLQKLAQKASMAAAKQKRSKPSKPDAFSGMQVEESGPDTDQASGGDTGGGEELPAEIFRAYDIRGRVDTDLNEERMTLIGRAIGSEAGDRGQQNIVVGRDGRNASPALCQALVKGITASGINVIDIGAMPTPLLYHAVKMLDADSGVCITGSHNPPEYNGVKVVLNGESLHGHSIQRLRERIAENELSSGEGHASETSIAENYINAVVDDIVLARPMKLVIDCGNGITGDVAPALFERLGCEVTGLYTEVDGSFPNHAPDPGQPDNLKALIDKVGETGADLGIAFDGDGDRLVVVTGRGEIIWPDRLMMLYARDLLSRSPGADILFDVKSSRELSRMISQQGGRPLMWKTGHSLLHAKLLETGAPLAGEFSGHIFFADRWNGFDDALYAAARLLEILSLESSDIDEVFAALKTGEATPELLIPSTDTDKFRIIEKLTAATEAFADGSVSTLDGLRVDFDDGWGLVRASNTQPMLTARFEGRDEAALKRIQKLFHDQLTAIDPQLDLPF